MIFKGHLKSSFIDYPHKISTVVFTGGCNFRCPYCHNSSLVYDEGEEIGEDAIFEYLYKRKKYIDGVCISGGEATLHRELYDFVKKVKKIGYLVKIDTNGTNPDVLERLINENLLDYIAMDIKAPFEKYNFITGVNVKIGEVEKSINLIKKSNIDYEFRTTVCRELLTKEDIMKIAEILKGSKRYIIQNFRDGETILAGKGKFTPYNIEELNGIKETVQGWFDEFKIR